MKKIVITSTVGLIYDGITNVIVSYLEAMDLQDLDIYIVATIKAEPTIIERMSYCTFTIKKRRHIEILFKTNFIY